MWLLLIACSESALHGLDPDDAVSDEPFGVPAPQDAEPVTPEPVEPVLGRLATYPADVDLYATSDCPASRAVTFENVGDAPVRVTSLDHRIDDGFRVEAPAFPLVLAPGERFDVTVAFEGGKPGEYASRLLVHADDPDGVHRADQRAHVGDGGARRERFVQGPFEAVDFVITLDETESMGSTRAMLAADFGTLVDTLGRAGLDWRMAVVTRDDGCANGGVLGPADPALLTRFTAAANTAVSTANYGYGDYGAHGWYAEAGLTLARNALRASSGGACNDALFGGDALTVVLSVSDERDQSEDAWDALVGEITAIRPATVVHAIAGELPEGCPRATPGYGYAEAAASTSGMFLSVCEPDLAFAWQALADQIVAQSAAPRTTYAFTQGRPDDDSIVVTVDGARWDAWSYEVTRNLLVFDVPPPPRAVVTIDYVDSGACE